MGKQLPVRVVLVGFGAIGRSLLARLHAAGDTVQVTHVVTREARVAPTQAELDGLGQAAVRAVAQVPADAVLVMECAGHSAIAAHVVPALQRGVECALLSIGALSEPGMAEAIEAAAKQGGTQAHLLAGAIGGIDAIAAARLAGLTAVTYTGRKPPSSWAPADLPSTDFESKVAFNATGSPRAATDFVASEYPLGTTVVFAGTAREAARRYPKNANVAATVALAGLGLDATQVRLLADASVSENVHEIHAQGAFGELRLQLRGKPLPDNPKTSALTVLSALRFLHNRAAAVTM